MSKQHGSNNVVLELAKVYRIGVRVLACCGGVFVLHLAITLMRH